MDPETILQRIRTPHKHGQLVLTPSYKAGAFDSHGLDCPFLFSHKGRYCMTYVGWDGIGYQTGLAVSKDLVNWQNQGLLIRRGPKGSVTEFNIAMTGMLRDNDLYGNGALKKVDGRFVGTYHAYPRPGFESGPAVIGLCFSTDLRHWEVGPPILEPSPDWDWESGGLYKSWLMEHDGTYHLFYNAKNRDKQPWFEQTGMATSRDLVSWQRHAGNPVLRLGDKGAFDDRFASDPAVYRDGDHWVMFYFGLSSDGHARDGAAYSTDLLNWHKLDELLIDVGPEGTLDSLYAHKPAMIAKDGQLFHFYCAVERWHGGTIGEIEHDEKRGISFAAS